VGQGFTHVCLINNHLEPAHDEAVRAAIAGFPAAKASVACPLEKRFARTLSEEFKRGECHAGRYETSLVLAVTPQLVEPHGELPTVPISLSQGIRNGQRTFREMGMSRAYAGAPALATAQEGAELLDRLAEMVVTTITERINS